jgi:hypothetical protein
VTQAVTAQEVVEFVETAKGVAATTAALMPLVVQAWGLA